MLDISNKLLTEMIRNPLEGTATRIVLELYLAASNPTHFPGGPDTLEDHLGQLRKMNKFQLETFFSRFAITSLNDDAYEVLQDRIGAGLENLATWRQQQEGFASLSVEREDQ